MGTGTIAVARATCDVDGCVTDAWLTQVSDSRSTRAWQDRKVAFLHHGGSPFRTVF